MLSFYCKQQKNCWDMAEKIYIWFVKKKQTWPNYYRCHLFTVLPVIYFMGSMCTVVHCTANGSSHSPTPHSVSFPVIYMYICTVLLTHIDKYST